MKQALTKDRIAPPRNWAYSHLMTNTRIATACLFLMVLIALLSVKPSHFEPITGLDRALAAIGDQTDLMKVLRQAEEASRPR